MAAHQLAIAKASFSAALLRPDPSTVPRDDIVAFHALLDKALSHCSQTNVQTCKEWLLHYVVSSSNRANVLGKYLAALSESFKPPSQQEEQPGGRGPPGKRSRLHILYLLNDIFHHTKYHTNNGPGAFVAFSGALQPHVLELLGFAASYDRNKNPKHHRRLDQLLDIWSNHGYYSADYIDKLREAVKNSESIDAIKASVGLLDGVADVQSKGPRRDAPYMMPATHGDPSSPYYDLPAGNFVPHIIPDSTAPIRPDMVKPLQFMAGPADKKLVDALQTFFNDVDRIYGVSGLESSENTVIDVDELGQPVLRNERGDIMAGDTYYGWSRDFCVQMKKRKAKGSSRSRSRNRRSRYSDSNSSDYDRISRSRSRSNSRGRRRYSRSQSRTRANSHGQPSRRSRSRSESYSPKPATPPSSFPNPHQGYQQQPPQPPYSFNNGSGFPPPYNGNIPPPPPHNFTGHRPQQGFPPPPPPIPSFPQSAPLMPPDTSSFPQPYQNRNQPGQYGGPQQMPPGSFPPPWQGGHQGGYNQGNGRW